MPDTIDVLAFSPHPDDAELYCAGTLLALRRRGVRVAVVDVSRGELSTRGDPETRERETAAATRVLGLDARDCLDIPDGGIASTPEYRLRVIRVLRRHRPRTVLLPYPVDRHPDHVHTATLVREAVFFSGLAKIASEDSGIAQEPHRPAKLFSYMMTHDFDPQFVIDISGEFDAKLEAIRCFASQFHTGDPLGAEGPQTYVSTPDFMASLIARSKRLGFRIGAAYGEGFEAVGTLGIPPDALL